LSRFALERSAGVLLHPTSLPSGSIDIDGDRWLNWLHAAGFSVWQMLPLCTPGFGLSPYQCLSAFALNPAHLAQIPPRSSCPKLAAPFAEFKIRQASWLKDFSLFMAIRHNFYSAPWYEWPKKYKNRDSKTLATFSTHNAELIEDISWQQFFTFRQWQLLKAKAHALAIKFFGDMPIFVAHDSADVWANPELFLLDENKMPKVVAGVPPDYFSTAGQRWGNPHYNWDKMRQNSFKWWLARIKHLSALFDILRIDHFRGLSEVWAIESNCETAVTGSWVEIPGRELLQAIQEMGGEIELVAEDLGIITEKVKRLRQDFCLPGMTVLQFGFEGGEDNPHHPHNLAQDMVVYTGTHDNDTLGGWYDSLSAKKKTQVDSELDADGKQAVLDKLKQIAFSSKSYRAILPLQDILDLPGSSRMNTPGTLENNWQWRFAWQDIPDELAAKLKTQLIKHGRCQNGQ